MSETLPKVNPEREQLLHDVMNALLREDQNRLDPKNPKSALELLEMARGIVASGHAQTFIRSVESKLAPKTIEQPAPPDWMDDPMDNSDT